MDLTGRLRAWAVASPRVLVVEAPGNRRLRWAVEAELDRRRWAQALSPSDADVLLVLGTPGPELAAAVDVLWSQVPRPRRRAELLSGEDVGERVTQAAHELATAVEQEDAATDEAAPVQAPSRPTGSMEHSGTEHSGTEHSGTEHSGTEHSGTEHSGMEHSGTGGGEHSGHHMHHGGDVAGLPMAQTAPDRDGLQLDVLHVSLGPVLPDWPTGLLLRADLQGDVITDAQLRWLDADADADADADVDTDADPRLVALDRLASLLSVAGWPTAARDVRRARDGLASPDPGERATAEQRARRVLRRVRRSRVLAWSLRGIGRLADAGRGTGGDVLDRMRRWCDAASDGAAVPERGAVSLGEVAALVQGTDVAAARLVVASVELQRSVARVERGGVRA